LTSPGRFVASFWLVLVALGCWSPQPAATRKAADTQVVPSGQPVAGVSTNLDLQSADSIVLERTACFGTCPAYRLRLTRRGAVAFRSRNFGDTLRTGVASIPESDVEQLFGFARMMAYGALPDTIANVPAYCGHRWTDHPTVTTTIFVGAGFKRVVDYQGCWWAPAALRRLEDLIDSTTHSSRWVRPNDLRRGAPPA
jgi:hypothetical protein